MFSFLGLRKDSKKSPQEKEADGFVILGETAEERRQKTQSHVQPATNVIVMPSKSSSKISQAPPPVPPQAALAPPVVAAEAVPALSELLGDVPFTLAPHILAMQAGLPQIPEVILSRDFSDSLSRYHYDFTLENSVLCDA